MKNENYINIQGWMINELKLKGNELILYAIIYGYSQDGKSRCKSSISYIMKAIGVSNRTAINLIDKLLKKKLITRHKNNTGNEYIAKSSLVNKVHTPYEQSSQVSSEQSSHNTNTNTNTNNLQKQVLQERARKKKMNIKEFKEYCYKSTQKHIHFIGDWAEATKPSCENLAEWKVFISRHLRPSKQAINFSENKIKIAFREILKDSENGERFKPTIETLIKYLTK